MKSLWGRLFIGLLACFAALFVADYLSLTLQIPNRPKFGSVHTRPYIAVPRKDGKTDFMLDDPVDEPCVRSLFPHFGDAPCWYLERHKNRRENL